MRYVLDTHALIDFASDDRRRLGKRVIDLMMRMRIGAIEAHVSVISLWEVALLAERGRLGMSGGYQAWSSSLRRAAGLLVEPLLPQDIENARAFPSLVDPADRLIVGTALRLSATLVTSDARITESGVVPVLW